MKRQVTWDTIRYFANTNCRIVKSPVRGVIVRFDGLGGQEFHGNELTDLERTYAEQGIVYVFPYLNPWNWMNDKAIRITDEILDVIFDSLRLENVPIVYSGGSMGGLCALVYTRYASRTPVACVTNCPVCDLVYHYSERPDLPRTLYDAFYDQEGDVEDILCRYSPYHLAEQMPDVRYFIWHGEEDQAVNIDTHSRRFVEKMRSFGKNVTLHTVPGAVHCTLGEKEFAAYHRCIAENLYDTEKKGEKL